MRSGWDLPEKRHPEGPRRVVCGPYGAKMAATVCAGFPRALVQVDGHEEERAMFKLDGPDEWFEVWWDWSSRPPYLLTLFGGAAVDRFDVYDPKEGVLVHTARTYQEATSWLSEDEYTMIEGRTTAGD
jgi:hypothetical protein